MSTRTLHRPRLRHPARVLGALALAGGALLLGSGVASAHVVVSAASTAPGAYTVLTFRVPTESAKASTTKLTVDLPTDTPLASVRFAPVPGWTATATQTTLPKPVTTDDATITEAVTQVAWTADSTADGVPPNAFQQFQLSVGPLPSSGTLRFRAIQGYSDGTTVTWADPPNADGSEPEHPAPTLTIGSAGAASTGPMSSASSTPDAAAAATAAAEASTDTTARVTAIAALVVAAFSVLVAAIAIRKQGPQPAAAPPAATPPARGSGKRR